MNETYNNEFTVLYSFTKGDPIVDFKAYEIIGHEGKDFTIPTYEGIGGCGADDKMTNEVEKANVFIHGTVKWDGCSHVYFGDEGYIHLCGSRYFVSIGELLKKIYNRCYEIGGFDYDKLNETKDNT